MNHLKRSTSTGKFLTEVSTYRSTAKQRWKPYVRSSWQIAQTAKQSYSSRSIRRRGILQGCSQYKLQPGSFKRLLDRAKKRSFQIYTILKSVIGPSWDLVTKRSMSLPSWRKKPSSQLSTQLTSWADISSTTWKFETLRLTLLNSTSKRSVL